ncbi:MAG: ATP-binding protein [Gammaproteobacteria bacterium]|nr:ATP-binding protein [Gammaproteobacteria bacterium]MDH5801290.1 ATP-binding protein [Gammaproteobacteria bacterium]
MEDTLRQSLAAKTLLQMGLRVAIVIVLMTMISYYHVSQVITDQALEYLYQYNVERANYNSELFKQAGENHRLVKQDILQQLRQQTGLSSDDEKRFSQLFEKFPDGTVRSRKQGFNGFTDASGFIGKDVKLSPALRQKALLLYDMSDKYGPVWHQRFQNIYFTTPENFILLYWPEYPNWAHDLPGDMDLLKEEYVWIADEENNPDRKPVWTGLFYDIGSDVWMVSLETPVDYQGKHIATIGHDIMLNELMERTMKVDIEGAYTVIFRDDGRLIVHPHKLEEIKRAKGMFDIAQSGDKHLKAIYHRVKNVNAAEEVIDNSDYDEYIVRNKIQGPGWNQVTIYPKSLVSSKAFATARLVLLIGALSLILEVLILWQVIRKNVSIPMQGFLNQIKAGTGTDLNIELDDRRNDELGQFASAFNELIRAVNDRSRELKESQHKLQQSLDAQTVDARNNRMLFENSPIGLALTDMEGNLVHVNQAYADIIGRSIDECYSLNCWDITPEKYTEDEKRRSESLRKTGSYGPYEKEHIHKDGRCVAVRLSGLIIRRDNQDYIWSSVEDISQRKESELRLEQYRDQLEQRVEERTAELQDAIARLEDEIHFRRKTQASMQEAKEEAEAATRLKSAFLGRMSHELRTPLNAILGFGQILQEEQLDEEQMDHVNEIVSAGGHLLDLINEVLDLSKIEVGKIDVNLQALRPGDIIRDSIVMVSAMAELSRISIHNHIDETSCEIIADKLRLKEVIVNLLSNAIKYNHKGGRVDIYSKVMPGDTLRIEIVDTGNGIDQKSLECVFEPFNRLGAEYSEIEGTGIGLTICKSLVELMQGEIGVVSVPQQGSTFWLELPLAVESGTTPSLDVQTESVNRQTPNVNTARVMQVLYIEDNPANLRLVESTIRKMDSIELLCATDAESGIELARKHKPDLVILDLNLPGINGYEALARLQSMPETTDLKCIALSASAMREHIEKGLKAGFRQYLTKPINLVRFRDALGRELGIAIDKQDNDDEEIVMAIR